MSRRIEGLLWARPAQRPAGMPFGRPRGAKAQGLRYERLLAQALPSAKHGQWFEFEDANGRGVCQTDLLLGRNGRCVVLECKYTWTPDGHQQLERLYLPVVQMALQRPVVGVVAAKKLVMGLPVQVASDLDEAMRIAMEGRRVVWHWTGVPVMARAA